MTAPWALWRRQMLTVLRIELRKNLFGKRAFLAWLLAALPVIMLAIRAVVVTVVPDSGLRLSIADDTVIFANIYQGFILRFVVFFGSLAIFANLARGDVIDKSLHYWFLVPVRREVIMAGKYLAGLISATVLFSACTLGSMLFLYLPHGTDVALRHLVDGPGLAQAASYLMVTILGSIAYGALFLAIGFYFRNPVIPAIGFLMWEGINFLLPPFLKKLAIVHYLTSLCPVPISEGPFAILADAPPVWVSIPGLIAVTVILLLLAARGIRRMEVSYATE